MNDWEITLIDQAESVDDIRGRESFRQYEFNTFQVNGLNERDVALFWCVWLLYLCIVFIFSGLTHYIYFSTSSSAIILRVLITLLFTVIVIIINLVIIIFSLILLLLLPLLFYFNYLFHLIFIYLYIHLLIRGPIRSEGSHFGRFFNPEMLRVERVG